MLPKIVVVPFVAVLGVSLTDCAGGMTQTAYGPMPSYCTQNNTAAGAVVGGILGAGIGAAFGGGRGAGIGAASGAVFGGLTGAQADAQCRQLAYQRAAEMAFAAQAQAASQGSRPTYQSMDYITPSTGVRHKVTPLNSHTDPATKTTCTQMTDVSFSDDGSQQGSTTSRVCKSADGTVTQS